MIAARDALAFYDTRRVRPTAMEVVGQHGSLTKAEREVPLLCFQAAGKTAGPGEHVAELVFFSGTMDCGKSTLALQMDYNHRARGRGGVRFSRNDRAGGSRISSRLGLETDAVEVVDTTDFWDEVVLRRTRGDPRRLPHLRRSPVLFARAGGTACAEWWTRSRLTSSRLGSLPISAPGSSPVRSG